MLKIFELINKFRYIKSSVIKERFKIVLLLTEYSMHNVNLILYFIAYETVDIISAKGVNYVFKLFYIVQKSFYFFRYIV